MDLNTTKLLYEQVTQHPQFVLKHIHICLVGIFLFILDLWQTRFG